MAERTLAGLTAETGQPNLTHAPRLSARFWSLLPVTGVGTGLAAAALMGLLRLVQRQAWGDGAGDFAQRVEASSSLHRVAIMLLGGLVVGTAALALRRKPGGGGAAEVTAAIWRHGGRLAFVQTLARAALSVIGVGFGASLGREGAPKQAGAAIASKLCDLIPIKTEERRLLAACGAGAGMAAVYNVPIGGALFALEILLGTISLPLAVPALLASGLATATAWVFLPPHATYRIPHYAVSWYAVAFATLLGPVSGVVSVGYMRLIVWADKHKPKGAGLAWEPVVMFTALGAVAIAFPHLLGNGRDLAEPLFNGKIAVWAVVALLVLKPLATAGCLGSGAPGGLFTPTIATGALLGALAGHLWGAILPAPAIGLCAILGATALFAASSQAPVCALVLALELTQRLDAVTLPLLVVAATSTLVARRIDPRSIYSARVSGGKAS